MPISSTAAAYEKKRAFRARGNTLQPYPDNGNSTSSDKNFLTIEPALPSADKARKLYKRSHSTVVAKTNDTTSVEPTTLHVYSDGSLHVIRTTKEKEKNPDRVSLDRRGLSTLPVLDNETKLRLLSLQHNLINNLGGFAQQDFAFLVFLDIYDNQLEKIDCLEKLENLRVLLMGKNRIKRMEGLQNLNKIEVLDLHGNQITHVNGLSTLNMLKVLNLAGNQIKTIGVTDLQGLSALQELNLRRNRLKKLLGFGETLNLQKLFLSNNDLQTVEDICSLAKSANIREISIDNNPILLGGDCISFLVSYLPQLTFLNTMQITEQVRKAAMAWRRNKEASNGAYMDLTTDICLNVRREEVISNARTNWELIRSQTRCLTAKSSTSGAINVQKNLKPECDIILTSLTKPAPRSAYNSYKVPALPNKKLAMVRTSSQDTENSQNTSSSNGSSNEFFRLPQILVPIINKLEQIGDFNCKEGSVSSIGPNVDSSVSSLLSNSDVSSTSSSSGSDESDSDGDEQCVLQQEKPVEEPPVPESSELPVGMVAPDAEIKAVNPATSTTTDAVSVVSAATSVSNPTATSSTPESDVNNSRKSVRSIRSAAASRSTHARLRARAVTAKPKKQASPVELPPERDREQGGDYLIEICGRHLNIYGQGALRFIDKPWSMSKSRDVNTINFNYANFNAITGVLNKLKQRFPNIDHFFFKETNISCLGQLNALAEVQGLTSLVIDDEGNPIIQKSWISYAIYRLSHWGLRVVNGKEVTEQDIQSANEEYKSLSDLVLWSLPNILLQPLLTRLRLDVGQNVNEQNAKKWLLSADPALQSVVSKEALQWKRGTVAQEDLILRQKARIHIGWMLSETCNAVNKLRRMDEQWSTILHESVRNILLDYSQIDTYMKTKIQELK